MNENEQKEIFAKNLNYYIDLSGKQQKEVAKELGFRVTTFNTWCTGKIIPGMGKVQKLADYFGIGKSDLLDEKLDSDPLFDVKILNDVDTMGMLKDFYELSVEDRNAIKHIVSAMNKKREL